MEINITTLKRVSKVIPRKVYFNHADLPGNCGIYHMYNINIRGYNKLKGENKKRYEKQFLRKLEDVAWYSQRKSKILATGTSGSVLEKLLESCGFQSDKIVKNSNSGNYIKVWTLNKGKNNV